MLRITQSITIRRSIEDVFLFVADLENAPRFDPVMLAMSRTSTGPIGVGTTYREVTRALGRRVESTFTVIACEPHTRVAFQGGPTPFGEPTETYSLSTVASATRVTSRLELRLRGAMKLAEPLAAFMITRIGRTRLRNMKRILENQSS